jgi:hypothetical protein
MNKFTLLIMLSTLICTMFLASCGGNQTSSETTTPEPLTATITEEPSTPTMTPTPDLCAPENLEAEITKVHRHMREFDDAANLMTANLAAGVQRDQLSESIANLQRIRRESEDEIPPPCLLTLKAYQIQHMNSGINTFIAIMTNNQQLVDQTAALARQQHDQYLLELSRLLGVTPIPATLIIPTPTHTLTPTP